MTYLPDREETEFEKHLLKSAILALMEANNLLFESAENAHDDKEQDRLADVMSDLVWLNYSIDIIETMQDVQSARRQLRHYF